MSNSTSWRRCSKVAWAKPAWTRRQKAVTEVTQPASSWWCVAWYSSCSACCFKAAWCASSVRRRCWYSARGMTALKYASVSRSSWRSRCCWPWRNCTRRACRSWGSQWPRLRPREGLGETLRVREHRTEVCPHQGVELLDGNEARGAAVGAARRDRLRFAGAEVVAGLARSRMYRASGARQPAASATDQGAQQIVVGGIVAAGGGPGGGGPGLAPGQDPRGCHRWG